VKSGISASVLAAACLATATAVLFAAGHPGFTAYLDWGLVRIGGEFLTGCLMFRAWQAKTGADRYWGWVRFAALIFAVPASTLHPALAVPAFALAVYALAWDEVPSRWLFGNRLVVYLGEISYSVYLVHWFVLKHAAGMGLTALPDELRVWVMFAVVIAASAATYHCIETPARVWLRSRLA